MGQYRAARNSRTETRGFTIIELVVVITIFALLLAIVVNSTVGYQPKGRDAERSSDVEVVSRNLERYYRNQPGANGASYPSSTTGPDAFANIVEDAEAMKAPGYTGVNSYIISNTAANVTPLLNQYVYQALNADGTLCTAVPCVRYKIYYRLETTGAVIVKDSLRQQ